MSARYTTRDKVKTATTALVVGMTGGAVYALPTVPAALLLAFAAYVCGVIDGRTRRRGGRVADLVRQARVNVTATMFRLFRRPAGG